MRGNVDIPQSALDAISSMARSSESCHEEICGVVMRGEHIPMVNTERPWVRHRKFKMDPETQLAVWNEWGGDGDLIVYHSHPTGTAFASELDRTVILQSPNLKFLIYAVVTGRFRAYQAIDGKVEEIKIFKTDIDATV